MPHTLRSSLTGLATLAIAVLIFRVTFHQQASFEHSAARKQRVELRTGTGAPLATIFVDSLGYHLDRQTASAFRGLVTSVPTPTDVSCP